MYALAALFALSMSSVQTGSKGWWACFGLPPALQELLEAGGFESVSSWWASCSRKSGTVSCTTFEVGLLEQTTVFEVALGPTKFPWRSSWGWGRRLEWMSMHVLLELHARLIGSHATPSKQAWRSPHAVSAPLPPATQVEPSDNELRTADLS